MVAITLPDGKVKKFDAAVTGLEVAQSIGAGLAKAALAIEVDGKVIDLSEKITKDGAVKIITRESDAGLDIIRHDAAHVMAEAVQELFPGTQVTIGPAIDNGFYYDFYRAESFTPDDLLKIEKKMQEIIARDKPFTREVWTREDAIKHFKKVGEKYKVELIEGLPGSEDISIYRQGDWLDLCRGPHAPSTGRIGKGFKLMKLAGAYWRGDSNNVMLQRIYGTAWADEKQLAMHLTMLEEADKRDHRKLGKQLQLFHQQEEAPGMVFWHPNGWTIYRAIQNYIRSRIEKEGYVEVNTPVIIDKALWEASGHWEKFRDDMFAIEADERTYAVKPMNCPGHVQIFNQGLKSYRDLPLRIAEFGSCFRNEPSGALHGIMRVRNFVQDDAHIFCMESQIESETKSFCKLLQSVYHDFGFEEIRVKFSDRPAKRAGTDATWDKAEAALKTSIEAAGLPYTMNPGEGAFYGPKLEFILKDAIGREWQCGTLQLDFVLPQRLGAFYVGEDSQKHHPVMLHRAIFGSLERFIGMLIENYAGKFPTWLAPVQVVVASITDSAGAYAEKVKEQLRAAGIRAQVDVRNEKINYKVREHSLNKVPYLFVVGGREAENNSVAIRTLGSEAQEVLDLQAAIGKVATDAAMPHAKEKVK